MTERPTSPREPAAPPPPAAMSSGNLLQTMELGEFLHGLGVMMRLPRKARPRGPVTGAVATSGAPEPRVMPWWVYASAAVALLVGMGAVSMLSRAPGPSEGVPVELYGRWVTTARSHASRSFQLDGSSITLQTGAGSGDYTVHPIRRVRLSAGAGGRVIRLEYEVDGGLNELAVTYRAEPRPTLLFVNQPEIAWIHP